VFVTVSQFHLNHIFAGKARAYPRGAPDGTPPLVLPANVRLG